jgi:predicted O-methyltransferase YrrM
MKSEFKFDENIICPGDPTATDKRIEEYKEYYKIKYEICKKQNPNLIVEIGIRAGYSAWTFLQACPEAKYIGIDANNGTHGGQGGQDGAFFEWADHILAEYDVELIEMDTQWVNDLGVTDVDFFHVDGDHTITGVQNDLTLALHAINDTGLILVDDITYLESVNAGVKAWVMRMGNKITAEFVQSLRGEMLIRKSV